MAIGAILINKLANGTFVITGDIGGAAAPLAIFKQTLGPGCIARLQCLLPLLIWILPQILPDGGIDWFA